MNQKGFVNILVIIGLVLLAGAAGYFALVKKWRPVPQQITTKDETANWKTYRNERYRFEIKYPPNYSLSSERKFAGSSLVSNYAVIDFNEEYFNGSNRFSISAQTGTKLIDLNGTPAFKYPIGMNGDGETSLIVGFNDFPNAGRLFYISASTNKKGFESKATEFDLILSTFKRISDWVTFDSITDGGYNEHYHFTLKYPATWSEQTEGARKYTSTIIADYDVNRTVSVVGQPGVSEYAPEPKEYCRVILGVSLWSTNPDPMYQNTYTSEQNKSRCEEVLNSIKTTLVFNFIPLPPEE